MIIVNDPEHHYTYFYKAYLTYLLSHLLLTIAGRSFILKKVKKQVLHGEIRFNTLLVGSNSVAEKIYKESTKQERFSSSGATNCDNVNLFP